MNRSSNTIKCFLCPQIVKSKDDYKYHLVEGHNMATTEDIFKISIKDKNRTKTSHAKLKRRIKGTFKAKLKNLFHSDFKKVQENLSAKFKLKSVRVNLKNIHMPKEDAVDDDLRDIPWYNRVKYQCLPCGKYVWGKPSIYKHVKQFHKIKESTLNFYRLVKGNDKYICKICNSVIKIDYHNLKRHLRDVHKTKVSEYGSVYEPDKTFNIKRNDLRTHHDNESYGIYWYNRVKYQCKLCEKKINGYQNITSHIRRIHTQKCIANYTVLTKNKYSCKICEKEISLNYTAIWKHMNIVNGMNFREIRAHDKKA